MTDLTPEIMAARLREAEQTNTPIDPIRESIANADQAYAIQEINTVARLESGGRLVGRKIGLTNPVVQKQLGVDQPDYGMLFADMEIDHGGEIAYAKGAQNRVEAELAFVIGKDLPEPQTSMAEVLRAIEYVVPSLEIVGSRIRDWDIGFVDTVADNASSAYFTLGPSPKRLSDVDLLNCKMEMTCNGDQVSAGAGRQCLGSPLNAVLWLARVMAHVGRPLGEGDIVLSGALGPMAAASADTVFTAQIEGFGETSVRFGA
ncbi:fumarylacetoacetate hydrolase family protein [uncultured Thalassospira sp.]|uniref:2-keto-4-pentenoate hydratase n=1 Tax=uncultured Thalassospira sp. TaxID=404382 RepID=UPI00258CCA3F|nr:fumarylacetoacetate hydrolase family protein [uncultured Thalassospira sp.]